MPIATWRLHRQASQRPNRWRGLCESRRVPDRSGDHAARPAAGVVALPAGQVREPIVDADDIADVVVAALTEDGHDGQLYEVTGPRLMSFDEIASVLSVAIGQRVHYRPITLQAFHDEMRAIGGELIADVLQGVCRETFDGRNEWVGDGVQRALGRAPRDFLDFCREAATSGVWNMAA